MTVQTSFNSATSAVDAIDTLNAALTSIAALNTKVAAFPPLASLGVATLSQNEGSSGATTFVYPVNLDKPWTSDISYEYVVAGTGANPTDSTDFVGGITRGIVVVPAGATTTNLTVSVVGDTTVEFTENFAVRLYRVAASSLGTILTDDNATWNNAVNLVIVGNSFIQGIGATSGNYLGDQIRAMPPYAGSGASSTVIGRSGFNWTQLDGVATTIDAAFVSGKVNILLVGETTNSVFNTPYYDAATTMTQAKTFVANRRASKAWDRIVVFGTVPRRDTNRSNANTVAANAIINAVDADMKASPSAYGVDLFVDVRAGTPFAFTDYTDASFQAASSFFSEADPNEVHPNNPGYGQIATKIAAALRTLPIPIVAAFPILGTLALSGALVNGTASSGNITGATSGSSIASNVSGLTVNNAARTYSWDGTGAAGTTANGLVETLAGATNTPKSNPITVGSATSVASLTMSSPTYGTGKFSQGMSGGTATVPASVQPLNAGVPFTAECWVTFSGTGLGVALGQRASGASAHAWYLGATSAGLVQASVYSGGSGHDIVSSINIKDAAFHHLALVVQAASTQLYVDGVLAGSNAFTVDNAALNADVRQLPIGGGPFPWVGVVDEIVYTSGAKYTANFTPQTAATASGLANTRGIYHLDGDGTGVV